MEPILNVSQLCKTYITNKRNHHVLRNIDLKVNKGDYISIMGPSGSGKSTLLYTISGMDHFTSGEVLFNGNRISDYSENEISSLRLTNMGFVFQQMHFLKNLSIYDNIILPGYMAKKKKRSVINAYADELVKKFNIAEISHNNIYEVSGGELQRACIARALINHPDILFADEPTGALNSSAAKEVLDVFNTVHKEGTTIMMVTHDVSIAAHADQVLYISDGKIINSILLGSLQENDDRKQREKKLYNWLMEMGW